MGGGPRIFGPGCISRTFRDFPVKIIVIDRQSILEKVKINCDRETERQRILEKVINHGLGPN